MQSTNSIELISVHKLSRGNVSLYISWKGQRVQTSEPNVCFTREDVEVQFANGCDPVFDEWRRPDLEEAQHNTARDIFTCSFENINVLRKEACLHPYLPQFTVEFQRLIVCSMILAMK